MKKKLILTLFVGLVAFSSVSCGDSDVAPSSVEKASNSIVEVENSVDNHSLYKHISNEDYLSMLENYSSIFLDKMSIVSTNNIGALIENNSSVSDLVSEIDYVISEINISTADLQSYFNEFDQKRAEAPMQTKIMTLLSDAQSALSQYKIGLDNLKLFINTSDSKYMDNFSKYMQKSQESITHYDSILNAELESLR